jgi:siroheme synthase-like protein
MAYFPLFVSMEGVPCLVIGGGRVALRKILTLMEFGAAVTVVSPRLLPEIEALSGIKLVRRKFREQDLEGISFLFAASSDELCNRRAAQLGRERKIPVNAADLPGDCDFFFPALVRRGDVVVGVSSAGKSPALTGRVRALVERALPDDLAGFAGQMGSMRKEIMERGGTAGEDPAYRRKIEEYFERYEDSESRNENQRACHGAD